MFCDKCGKNYATTHIKTVINGVVTEQNLCSHCAAGSSFTGFGTNGVSQMLSSILGAAPFEKNSKKCEVCGADFSLISKTGKMGCSECYKTFKNELLPYIKRIHGSVKHIGNTSKDLSIKTQINTVEDLKNQLKNLIEEENYEQAAVVRDKIRELEGK